MTFGEALRTSRRDAGISQRDLAAKIGLDFSYISKLENDRLPSPSADTVVKICEVLGIAPERLLSVSGKLPTDIQGTVGGSVAAQQFLREAQEFRITDEEWTLLSTELRRLREE